MPTCQCVAGDLIREIPEPYQQAIRLSELEGQTQRELAGQLGLSHSGAKSRVQRARSMLKKQLERCCVLQFDRRNNLADCEPKPGSVCKDC